MSAIFTTETSSQSLQERLRQHRGQLRNLVRIRMDTRVRGRVDPSDVIQETYLEASRRIDEYLKDPSVPFYVWLRFLTLQRLAQLHRQHLGVQARDANREVTVYRGPIPQATSAAIAAHLIGQLTSPSEAAIKTEMKMRLQQALNEMSETDREVLCLRHFEHMSQKETAQILEISEKAAGARHLRALTRLRKALRP